MNFELVLLVCYSFIGASIKYLDIITNVSNYNVKTIIISLVCGLIVGIISFFDTATAIIFFGIIIGNAFAKKVDTIEFQLLGIIALVSFFLSIVLLKKEFPSVILSEISLISVGIISISSYLDEKINDYSDRKKKKPYINKILNVRIFTPIIILIFSIFGYFKFIYFILIILLDTTYKIVEKLYEK